MTDADAPFLAAIRAAPGDPQPHTIYADWLFDQPGRAPDAALRYVLLEPGDDSHRLAYADRLEETAGVVACPHCAYDGCTQWGELCAHCAGSHCLPDGRAERAEFIRVQVELARPQEMVPAYIHCDDRGKHVGSPVESEATENLRRRERELLSTHPASWIPDAIHALNLYVQEDVQEGRLIRFSRGFVASLTLTAADLLAHAAAVFGAAPVERVLLSCRQPSFSDDPADFTFPGPHYVWSRAHTEQRQGYNSPGTPHWLPAVLYDLLEQRYNNICSYYATAEAALTDLSAACVRFGRHAAGLPEWRPYRPACRATDK